MVAGVCVPGPMAMVQVPSTRWREREVSSYRMWTARASSSSVVTLSVHMPRSWAAACFALSLGKLASPYKRAYSRCPRPQGRGGRRWWAGRLASGVGARFHARPASWGAAVVRGLVCCSARGRVPVTRSGSMLSVPQSGVIALEVCLARHREGRATAWSRCGSRRKRGAASVRTVQGSLMQDSMKASNESSSRLCPLGDLFLPAARPGVFGRGSPGL